MLDFQDAENVLDLGNIRKALIRMEDTILFNFIDRAAFSTMDQLYRPHGFESLEGPFLDWIIKETERLHSQVRRYEAPDENPFFPEVLQPLILPPLHTAKVLADYQKEVNVNQTLKALYVERIVPRVASRSGVEAHNSGSCALCDMQCLQALSRRIHFGKFVAEAKYREQPEVFAELARKNDTEGIAHLITKPSVEEAILDRIKAKAASYGTDPRGGEAKVDAEQMAAIYREVIIPLTKEVEIEYLLRRPSEPLPE